MDFQQIVTLVLMVIITYSLIQNILNIHGILYLFNTFLLISFGKSEMVIISILNEYIYIYNQIKKRIVITKKLHLGKENVKRKADNLHLLIKKPRKPTKEEILGKDCISTLFISFYIIPST